MKEILKLLNDARFKCTAVKMDILTGDVYSETYDLLSQLEANLTNACRALATVIEKKDNEE